jgi:ABC-type multidrug transport system ATPase subunit/ABC-type multidrug transport system permease subunit
MKPKIVKISRPSQREHKKTIDMVTRLYVHLLKSDIRVSSDEVAILYTVLVNLFHKVDVSWEVYIRQVLENDIPIAQVVSYLNAHLTRLDKIRILLSIVIMANTDNNFAISEITTILDLGRQFNLETDGFMNLINSFETKSDSLIIVEQGNLFNSAHNSLFYDYLTFGRETENDIIFKDKIVSERELLLILIDKFMFVLTSAKTTSQIDGIALKPNMIYFLSHESVLTVGNINFEHEILSKMYLAQETYDIIYFHKQDYDFRIINNKNRYSVILNQGTIYRNGKSVIHNKESSISYDDIMQIKGDYAPFTLQDVIHERSDIGVENIVPKELFINHEGEYFALSRTASPKTVIRFTVDETILTAYPVKKGFVFSINGKVVTQPTTLHLNVDVLSIQKGNYRINSFYDMVDVPFEINHIEIMDIKHYFKDNTLALDSVSFSMDKGEFVGILGQSGCGKSTLLKTISGEIHPTYGSVKIDGKNLYRNIMYFTEHFGYVPQEDLLFNNLTVYENLMYRGKMRMPTISREHLDQKISIILNQTNLMQRKYSLVGDLKNKLMSGGERKRLNIALEMLFEPTLIICDEPTSGLSSSDAEQVIDMLKELTMQGKLVLCTIHQPNADIYSKFDKVLLMDNGGRQVFYGTPDASFSYFDTELSQTSHRKDEIDKKRFLKTPDYVYDVISYPEYRENGEIAYEQVNQRIVVKRKFPPEYWRDRYKRKMLFEIISNELPAETSELPIQKVARKRLPVLGRIKLFLLYIKRNFQLKIRNRTNMMITFMEAPLLGLIVGFILRLAPEADKYSYYRNTNIGVYIFVSIIVFIFLGMSSSIQEILEERRMILREKMMNLRASDYLGAKVIILSLFAILQVILYYAVSASILEMRGIIGPSMIYYFSSSVIGFSMGLFISSFLNDSRAIINILPLVLIPQIIFGGAIIQYEKMNQDLKLFKKSPIPEIVQIIPSRWLFEGMFTAQSNLNAYSRQLDQQEKKRLTLEKKYRKGYITFGELQSATDKLYQEKAVIAKDYPVQKYTNRNINSAVNMMDGHFLNTYENVFLSSYKHLFDKKYKTYVLDLWIVLLYAFLFQLATLVKLKYFFKE